MQTHSCSFLQSFFDNNALHAHCAVNVSSLYVTCDINVKVGSCRVFDIKALHARCAVNVSSLYITCDINVKLGFRTCALSSVFLQPGCI